MSVYERKTLAPLLSMQKYESANRVLGGVINPCGRCRQHMFDYYPDIKVIITDGKELRVAGVDELIPFAYVSGFVKGAYPHLLSKDANKDN